ncbi:MAG TPA: hypothetical protein VHW47_10245 [Acidimicrobiales bacterium]|jgi:hypothetical protein|nr:hypothetical protein [Acidimicrobiales bacterium]
MAWDTLNAGNLFGAGLGRADSGSGGVTSGVQTAVQTSAQAQAPLYSPDNPLFWFGGALLLALGAITFSTSLDVGPLKTSAKG